MQITTRFSEGDKIFFLHNGKAVTTVVRGAIIERRPQNPGVTIVIYLCNENEGAGTTVHIKVSETVAFGTKEELLNSL